MLEFTQLPEPLHASSVHKSESVLQVVPAAVSGASTQAPLAGLQTLPPSHGPVGPGHDTEVPATHIPDPSHTSSVQALLSRSQEVPAAASGRLSQAPVVGLQTVPPSHELAAPGHEVVL